jgi:uncharacterized glyoxalase superfamily protein PhnB
MKITPELLVEDLPKTLEFYTKNLDFHTVVAFPEDEPFFALIENDQAQIMLYKREPFAEEIAEFSDTAMGGSFVLYIDVADVQAVHDRLKLVAPIIQPLHDTTYGTREFTCQDPNGYKLMFAQKIS